MTEATYSPWRQLRGMPDVILGFRDDLLSGRAWWSPAHQVILMAKGLTQRARRTALAHELAHIDLGHAGCHDYPDADRQDQRIHSEADQLAARRLIPLDRLVYALKWSRDLEEVADELWVEPHVVVTRLDHLHPAERHLIRRVLAEVGE